jgi:hypothetical protein
MGLTDRTLTEKQFKTALLLVCGYLIQNKAKKCEIKDEIIQDFKYTINVEIKSLENIKDKKKYI